MMMVTSTLSMDVMLVSTHVAKVVPNALMDYASVAKLAGFTQEI